MTASRARVIRVMIEAPCVARAGSSATPTSSAGKVLRSLSAKASRFARVGLNTRTRRSRRTATMAATCVRACLPLPMTARSSAPASLIQRVAIPDMAAVRICPSARASMIAKSFAVVAFHNRSRGVDPAGVLPQVLVPNTPAPSNTAPIACMLLLAPQCAAVFSIFRADPAASSISPRPSASIASPRCISWTTSASEIQRGAGAVIAASSKTD